MILPAPESAFLARQRSPNDSAEQLPSFPVSFARQRLWFLHYHKPAVASYNLPAALRLTGRLDAGALEESLNEIVRPHDALRASFPMCEGRPVQVISPARQVALLKTGIRDVAVEARERGAYCLAGIEAARPFDLARGPLFRARLLRLAEDQHDLMGQLRPIGSSGQVGGENEGMRRVAESPGFGQ